MSNPFSLLFSNLMDPFLYSINFHCSSPPGHKHFPLANTNTLQPRWLGSRRLFSPWIFPGINRMRSIASVSNCPPFSGQRCLPCTLLLIRPAWISFGVRLQKKYPWARFFKSGWSFFFLFLLHGAFPGSLELRCRFYFPLVYTSIDRLAFKLFSVVLHGATCGRLDYYSVRGCSAFGPLVF